MGEVLKAGARTYAPLMRDINTIDSEPRLVAALRRAARGGRPAAVNRRCDALLDERRKLTGAQARLHRK